MSQSEVIRFLGLDAIISPSVRMPEHFVPKPEREREKSPKIHRLSIQIDMVAKARRVKRQLQAIR
jgi:hypothetical protein